MAWALRSGKTFAASGGTTATVGNGGTMMRALHSAANHGFGVLSTTFCGTIWGYACGTLFLYTMLLSPIFKLAA